MRAKVILEYPAMIQMTPQPAALSAGDMGPCGVAVARQYRRFMTDDLRGEWSAPHLTPDDDRSSGRFTAPI